MEIEIQQCQVKMIREHSNVLNIGAPNNINKSTKLTLLVRAFGGPSCPRPDIARQGNANRQQKPAPAHAGSRYSPWESAGVLTCFSQDIPSSILARQEVRIWMHVSCCCIRDCVPGSLMGISWETLTSFNEGMGMGKMSDID